MPIDQTPRAYDPAQDPGNPLLRPAYKTPEFWLSTAATVLPFIAAASLFPPDSVWAKVVALAIGVLAQLGYTGFRTAEKQTANREAAEIRKVQVKTESEVKVSEITGQVPVAVVATPAGHDSTTTTTTTETGPPRDPTP